MKTLSEETLSGLPCTWVNAPERPDLGVQEVHIWRASLLSSFHDACYFEHILSFEEKERSERFHFRKDRDRFIASRGLLRVILGRYLQMNPCTLSFRAGTYGKPCLAEKTCGGTVRFSLSRSRDLALFAFSRNAEIGIDMEYIRPDIPAESMAELVLSQNESDMLKHIPPPERQKTFYSIWTRKEALMKATGAGLANDVKKYDVITGQSTASFALWNLDVRDDHSAAVAVMGNVRDLDLTCYQY